MNQSSHFRSRPIFGTFLAAAGLFIAGQSAAQDYALLTSKPLATANPRESTRPFWTMTTQPGADSTLVGFYTPGNTLMYQEKLPNQAVKLTKKNLRALNETTDRITGMESATIPANTLANALSGKKSPQTGQLKFGSYASRDGIHLHLMMENPGHEFVLISLIDQNGSHVYQTSTRLDKSHFKFNLEGMPSGNYQLQVRGRTQRFERDLAFSYPKPEPTLQMQSPELRIAKK